ncbi:MAG: ABC transporter permease [Candidatus Dadabacteria bacterium]|nr:MAG: ABC transporter permease [Candidatus Dadabacteria bacterium]
MRWLIARLLSGVMAAFVAFALVFSLLRLIPGDPVELMLGEQAQPAAMERMRAHLGLDRPWSEQLAGAFAGLMRGDLGTSLTSHQPVSRLIAVRIGPTAALAASAMAVALLIAWPIGLRAGWWPGSRADRAGRVFATLGISIPNFWLGPVLLLVFAVTWPVFPLGGYRSYSALVLPAVTLGTALAAMLTRLLRASLFDVRQQTFVVAARARGLDARQVLWRHALRPALSPVWTVFGLQVGALLSGAVITETVFQWPGVGRLLIDAVRARDYPVVQGVVVLLTGIYVVVNVVIDIGYAIIDPRVRSR